MLTPNTKIQNYRLLRKLGEGGMGEVWLAEHATINRKVAIKVLHPQYARNPKIQQRFRNEAATLSKLKHPNIVALYDFIENETDIYLVMEYVEGRNLEEIVRTDTGPMPTETLVPIFKQILAAVGYAHQQGVVHRDIKPSNFMMGADGIVKVMDFGIAKLLEDDQHLTKTGMRMGTTSYMSPEQVNTEPVDHRSDIYSLGVTLFFLATGKAPYEGETSEYKVFDQIVREPLPAGRNIYVGVAPVVDAVIARATKKAVGERFQGCGEFLAAIGNKALQVPVNSNQKGKNWLVFLRERAVLVVGILVIMCSGIFYWLKPAKSNGTSQIEPMQSPHFEQTYPEEKKPSSRIQTIDGNLDSDNDGIKDLDDHCPKLKGDASANGCPDRDGDGVFDKLDLCPTNSGSEQHMGCPDSDHDGVFDDVDFCISLKGELEYQGCPDMRTYSTKMIEMQNKKHDHQETNDLGLFPNSD